MQDSTSMGYKPSNCFISALPNVNIQVIEAALQKRGIESLILTDLPPSKTSSLHQIRSAIAKAEFFVAVLSSDSGNENQFIEIGCAYALDRRILILVPVELNNLPYDILGLLYLRISTEDEQAIEFAVDQLLASPASIWKEPRPFVSNNHPLGNSEADTLLAALEAPGINLFESQVSRIVELALEGTGISTIAREWTVPGSSIERGSVKRADLAVWVDELDPWIGNPLIIEVKTNLKGSGQAETAYKQISRYLQQANTRYGLVLYVRGDSEPVIIGESGICVFFLQLRDLINQLRDKSFLEVLRQLRNNLVHGGGQ